MILARRFLMGVEREVDVIPILLFSIYDQLVVLVYDPLVFEFSSFFFCSMWASFCDIFLYSRFATRYISACTC